VVAKRIAWGKFANAGQVRFDRVSMGMLPDIDYRLFIPKKHS